MIRVPLIRRRADASMNRAGHAEEAPCSYKSESPIKLPDANMMLARTSASGAAFVVRSLRMQSLFAMIDAR